MVVITKIDICPPQILEQTIQQITRILKSPGARKIPIFIKNREECINTATQFVSQRICPVFQVSNVTGESLDLVRTFLNILPHHGHYDAEAPFEVCQFVPLCLLQFQRIGSMGMWESHLLTRMTVSCQ